ncbi:MAG: TRAP transporter fused permease subunit [Maritimibacter sp.]|nr:TRAP transporter fused permease subunit [Maritimibacter sp.]
MLRRLWLGAGAVAVFAPLARDLAPPGLAGLGLSNAQFLAFELALALVAVFARQAARKGGGTSALLALAAALAGLWTVRFLGTDRAVFLPHDADVVAAALFLVAAVLFAAGLSGGRPIALLAGVALVAGYAGPLFVPQGAAPMPLASYASYLAFGSEGLLGRALDIMVTPVLAFVVFGAFFEASGGAEALARVALRRAAQSRSGAIKACILASGLFGAISGTAIANVMTTGAFSIPAMRRIGVRAETAAGIEAAASTAGQVMPPVMGAAAFLLADFVGLPYATVALASLLPALFVYLAMFRQADLVPLSDAGADAPPPPAEPLPARLALHLLPPGLLVLLLAGFELQPDRAALAGALACIGVGLVLGGPRALRAALRAGLGRLVGTGLQLLVIAGAMGLVLGVLNATGLAVAVAVGLSALGQHSLVLALALAGAAAFLLGMGMATVGVYVLAAALIAPGLIEAGVPPLAAHLFVLYCGILSMLTPPVALASLAASALAKADFAATARAALRFGWVLFAMPFAIVARPGLVGLGGSVAVGQAIAVTLVFLLAATQPGLRPVPRAGLAGLALGAVVWPGADWVSLAASALVAAVLLARRRSG